MRKIVVGAFVSLDGVMQAPGGPEEDPTGGFKYGGWVTTHWDDTIGAAMAETFAAPFDLLLGRTTYDIFAAHWPYIETDPTKSAFDKLNSDIARTFNAITKYVATHSPETLSWRNSQPLGSDVVAAVRALKKQDGPLLLTQGSTVLLQTLLAHDLVDEFRLVIFPIVLGNGKRLFGNGVTPAAFRLTKSTTSPSGVLLAIYERAGEIATGSFGLERPTEAEIERRKALT
ncbi:MAG TPA: dihydrofolate reductase family protein [Beijerinckiaceae bacterium]|nr:dihydrofolate reductase family protein [Beijerinckiaceae bacterium]